MSVIAYSEFNTLTDCERKWAYRYVLNEPEPASRAMSLGTLCHRWHENWLLGHGAVLSETWTETRAPDGTQCDPVTVSLSDFDPELLMRATWLAGRFVEFYGPQPPSYWNVIGTESYMEREFTWGTLVGRSDGWVDIDGELTLIELKTYGSRPGPLAFAQVHPQLGCYSLLAEAKYGQRPDNILYQGIYTYQWKPVKPTQKSKIEEWIGAGATEPMKDLKAAAKMFCENESNWTERPAAESFDQLEVELGDHHLRTTQQYLGAALRRRKTLLSGASLYPENVFEDTLPSVGAHCSYCGFKAQCWMDLGGVEPMEIEVEDDDAEPV